MEQKHGQEGHAEPSREGGEALGMMRSVQPGMQRPRDSHLHGSCVAEAEKEENMAGS